MDELTIISYHWILFFILIFILLIIDAVFDKNYILKLVDLWLLKSVILLLAKPYYGFSFIICLTPIIQVATIGMLFGVYAFLIITGKKR